MKGENYLVMGWLSSIGILFCDLQLPWQVGRFSEVSKTLGKVFKFSSLLMFKIQEIFKSLKT